MCVCVSILSGVAVWVYASTLGMWSVSLSQVCLIKSVCLCRRLWMELERQYLAFWLESPSLLTWKRYVYKFVSSMQVKSVFFLVLHPWMCVCMCVWVVCVGGGAGGHDQSISLIMRSEGCHYGGPSGMQRFLFRKGHRCLLSSEQTRTSLTFCASTTPTRRHLLPPICSSVCSHANKPFFLALGDIL